MKYLFLYTISPVQSFIAEARKAQDLYAGSNMLSDLMLATIAEAKKQCNSFELIFPSAEVERKPNRFIAILEPKKGLNDFGTDLKRFTNNLLLDWADEYLWKIVDASRKLQDKSRFYEKVKEAYQEVNSKGQINHFLEVYWVGQIYEPLEYANLFGRLEQYLGAAKSMRDIGQLHEQGRKCSMNGNYDVLFYRKSESESPYFIENKLFKTDQEDVFVLDYEEKPVIELDGKPKTITVKQLQDGEGLSAISFLKRVYKVHEIEKFPSTAQVALYHTRQQLSSATAELWKKFEKTFKESKTEFDYQYYFEENLIEKRIGDKDLLKELKQQHLALRKALKKEGLKFDSYYALIHFDGDQMGKFLSGKQFIEPDQHDLKQFQKTLSEKLGLFSKWAYRYLNEGQKGRAVYAGGDDFLGFININHLFEVLVTLRRTFDNMVNQSIQQDLGYALRKALSFSAGIIIAHYKEPLSIIIGKAKKAEEIAKNETQGDRNAFCLFAAKHSGEMHQTWFKWQYYQESKLVQPLHVAEKLWSYLSSSQLSNTFIHQLALTFNLLIEDGKNEGHLNPNKFGAAFALELKRLLKRSIITEKKKEISQLLDFSDELLDLFKATDYHFTNFIQLLFITDFIYRNTNPVQENRND
jgi:CRISPR-associated protein Cmr2